MKKYTLLVLFCCLTGLLAAQTAADEAFATAKEEIEATFGFYPTIFQIIPDHQVPGMWAYFKAANSPDNAIPAKYRELINLAVAAQIPCDYCIYYHSEAAKAYGATEAELREAVMSASITRAFSMIIQGNRVEMDQFKEEFERMMAYMAEQTRRR